MVHEVSSVEEFNSIIDTDGLVIVDFHAQWCGPCKRIAPMLEQLADKYTNVTFIKVDVDALPTIATFYQIKAMPTFILIKSGIKVDESVGASIPRVESLIQKYN